MPDVPVVPTESFSVLVDPFGRYAVWPADSPPPVGCEVLLGSGTEDECQAYLDASGLLAPAVAQPVL